jgi:hypothetical protein
MYNEQIARLFADLAQADHILSESLVLMKQQERSAFPLIAVDLEGVTLATEGGNPDRITFMPVRMERVELDVPAETVERIRQRPDLFSELADAIAQRAAAETRLAFFYGITLHGGIPHARQFNERILPPLVQSR